MYGCTTSRECRRLGLAENVGIERAPGELPAENVVASHISNQDPLLQKASHLDDLDSTCKEGRQDTN